MKVISLRQSITAILLAVLITASASPLAYALTPSVNTTCVRGSTAGTSVGCALTMTSGHTEVVIVLAWSDSSSCPPIVNSVTDTASNTYLLAADSKCQNQVAFGGQEIWIYYASSSAASGSQTVTASFSGTVASKQIMAFDISAAPVNIVGPVTGSGTISGTGTFGTASLAYGNSVLLSGIIGGVGINNFAGIGAGTGFTGLQDPGCAASFCWGLFGEYSTSATVASPTTFPWTVSSYSNSPGPWLEMGVAIGPAPNGVVKVVPCTFFELQCWLYPTFFFGVYLALVLGIAVLVRIDRADMEGFALEALALGGLLAVIMGMLPIMIPLLITLIQVIRFIRG